MNQKQYSKEFIFKFKTNQNFPINTLEKECLNYKELLFEEDKQKQNQITFPTNKLSESFIIENIENKEEEKQQKRAWINNDSNRKNYNKNVTNNTNNTSLNWKSSKYMVENQDKDNSIVKNKPNEETLKGKKELKEKKEKIRKKSNADAKPTESKKENEDYDSDVLDKYFINSQDTKIKTDSSLIFSKEAQKSSNSNIQQELDKKMKSIIKNAIDDEENDSIIKENEGTDEKKQKKKKKKNKNKHKISDAQSQQNNTSINFINQTQENITKSNNSNYDQSNVEIIPQNNQNFQTNPQFFNNFNNIYNPNVNDTMFESNNKIQLDNSVMDNNFQNSNQLSQNLNFMPNISGTGNIQFFQPNVIPPMQGFFYGGNTKVIFPPFDPSKNLNILFPNNIIPNIVIETVLIENIYLFNKKFNIELEKNTWYIFNPLNTSISLPLSSKQIYDMYNMKIINGEIDIRPIDIFQYLNKVAFSFMKLKAINDQNWVDEICDSQLLSHTELFRISYNIKGEFFEGNKKSENRKSDNVLSSDVNRLSGNKENEKNNIKNNSEDDFEVVGKKKKDKKNPPRKDSNHSNQGNKPKKTLNINDNKNPPEKKPLISNNIINQKPNISKGISIQSNLNTLNNIVKNTAFQQNHAAKQINQNNFNVVDDTLNFTESIIHPKILENTYLDEHREIVENLIKEESKELKKQNLQNILIDAEENWEVVDKRKKKQQKEKQKVQEIKIPDPIRIQSQKVIKEEDPEESIDIVEKLKMVNPYYQQKETKSKDTIEELMNNNKFEVVVKKKKKKNDGKSKLPGLNS